MTICDQWLSHWRDAPEILIRHTRPLSSNHPQSSLNDFGPHFMSCWWLRAVSMGMVSYAGPYAEGWDELCAVTHCPAVVAAGDLSHCGPAVAVNNGWMTVHRLALRAPLLIHTHYSSTWITYKVCRFQDWSFKVLWHHNLSFIKLWLIGSLNQVHDLFLFILFCVCVCVCVSVLHSKCQIQTKFIPFRWIQKLNK